MFEIASVVPERTVAFRRAHEREALSTFWGFPVVWHEQRHELAGLEGEEVVAAAGIAIAASLARIESLIVARERRLRGIGAALLDEAASLGKYYNCHKLVAEVPARSGAQAFFERCGYRVEAVLPQHTWKLDVAVMRKFLL